MYMYIKMLKPCITETSQNIDDKLCGKGGRDLSGIHLPAGKQFDEK